MRRSMDGYTSAGKYLGSRTFGHTGFTGELIFQVVAYEVSASFYNANLGHRVQDFKNGLEVERNKEHQLVLTLYFM